MDKETLKGFGLTDEQIEQVWKGITDNYVTKTRFNEVNADNKTLKESVKERDGQLETLKSATGVVDTLKQQIIDLQAANQEKDKEHAAEMKRLKRDGIDERLLADAGAINPVAVKPFLTVIDDGVDDEGYTAVRKQHIEALIAAESTKFLFRAEGEEGQFTGIKPGETGVTKPHNNMVNPFAKDTYNEVEQIRLFKENPELARTLAKQAGINFYD